MGAQSMQGDVNILAGLAGGFLSLIDLSQGLFTGSHLWFLYYLTLVTGVVLGLRCLFSFVPGGLEGLARKIDPIVAWISRSQLNILALAIPTAACLMLMNNWGVDTPDQTLEPHYPALLLYGSFFFLGWMFHRKSGLIENFAKLSPTRFIIAALAIGITIYLSKYQNDIGHPNRESIHAVFSLCYAIMMWSLVALSIGLFKRFLDKPNRVVRYIADASYWLYLIHLPIVVYLQIAFAELNWHWALKLATISTLTIAISLALYDLFVRNTEIGQTLNGRKKPRVIFTSKKKETIARSINGESANASSASIQ